MSKKYFRFNWEAGDLQNIPMENETWDAKFKVMNDLTKHHMDEEESAVFSLAKASFSQDQLNDMGRCFREAEGMMPA